MHHENYAAARKTMGIPTAPIRLPGTGIVYCAVKLHTVNVPPGVAFTRLPQ